MDYNIGPYIKKDLKKIKIQSAEEDIKNHYKIFKGKVEEIKSPYSVPLADFLYEIELENYTIYFFKDRISTTNPKLPPSKGIRIVFALYMKNKEAKLYVPFLIFLAKDEGKRYYAPNGKRYPLTSSFFKYILEAKLEYL